MKSYILVVISIVLGVLGQLFMKMGMIQLGDLGPSGIMTVFHIVFQPWVFAGLVSYGIAMLVWVAVLTNMDLSYAYPLLSSGYVLVALGSWWMFGETISLVRWGGILIISLGVGLAVKK
ncbi:hypothetical protein GO013_07515 [Pseudodesulfovibrio sp. JC047]|uniref:hypothetical protein n=1 Tax=Pseudodesulfovibrio sp. JC047 TaxID=2683199 RepID=UPI0013D591ED|nr:hypothetical protein [Pseudodesulfovibrio sp. JC047]NDV19267.1 hypothetical protein [Pseudodesulfovibrio sp. JC047]